MGLFKDIITSVFEDDDEEKSVLYDFDGKTVVFHDDVEYIGQGSMADFPYEQVQAIVFPRELETLYEGDFAKPMPLLTLLDFTKSKKLEYTEEDVFCGCPNLRSLVLPQNLIAISTLFKSCPNLTEVHAGSKVESLCSLVKDAKYSIDLYIAQPDFDYDEYENHCYRAIYVPKRGVENLEEQLECNDADHTKVYPLPDNYRVPSLKLGTQQANSAPQFVAAPAPPQAVAAPAPPQPASYEYHISVNGQQYGQYTMQQMMQMVPTSQLIPQTLVWRQGLPQWLPAINVPELASLFAPQPPIMY